MTYKILDIPENMLSISITRDNSNIIISLPKKLSFSNENMFNKLLKSKNILRTISINN